MEHRVAEHMKREKKPLPKRGQIKAQIFGSLIRSITHKTGSRKGGKDSSPNSAPSTPIFSGYTSDTASES